MLGMSRTVKQDKTVEYEFIQLRQLADGVLAFVPQPSGRPPTTFRLSNISEFEAVFEKSEHDFPQRIAYSQYQESELLVSIEGPRNGAAHRVEFKFSRVACEAATASTTAK